MNVSNNPYDNDIKRTTLLLNSVNIGLGLAAIILNATAFIFFMKTKNLRCNLFYRLLFPILLLHSIGAIFLLTDQFFILQGIYSYYYPYVYVVCLVHSMICMQSSVTQTAIIAIDRYQASLPHIKSLILKRRQKLGIVSVASFVLTVVFVYTTVFRSAFLITDEVIISNAVVTSEIRIAVGVIYFLSIYIVEIPMCILTCLNIRKTIRTIGIRMVQPINTEIQVKDFQTPTVKKTARKKLNALKILFGLVVMHCLAFTPQLIMLVSSLGTIRNFDHSYSGIFRLFSLVLYIMDALFVFSTVRPLKEELKCMCRCW